MTGLPFAMSEVSPVANDNGGSPVGVGVETAIPAPEHRLALAVIRVPVSAARASLGRALRRDGDGWYAEFGGFLPQEFADVADGRLDEALVEFALGGDVLARCRRCASGRSHHADGVQAFDGYRLGLGFQQDVADLPPHLLVATLGVAACLFPMFGYGVAAAFAVSGLAGEVVRVFAAPLALLPAVRVVGPCTVAERSMVLATAVGAENVIGTLDVRVFQRRGVGFPDLDMETVMPLFQPDAMAVLLDWHQPYGAYVQLIQGGLAAQPQSEFALAAGDGLTIVVDSEQPFVGDGKAHRARLAGAYCQRTTVGADVPLLGCFAFGLGVRDAP